MKEDIEIEIDAILSKNRSVLKQNYSTGKTTITIIELTEQGFSFPYHTHKMKHQDHDRSFEFCYEYGIGEVSFDKYEIIKLPFYTDDEELRNKS